MGELRILSRNEMVFRDRTEAGQMLGRVLKQYAGKNPVVLGIPRGGVVVAREIALMLGGELDIVLAHKLRAPYHPELALGSLTENGKFFINQDVENEVGADKSYIEHEKLEQMAELKRRSEFIRKVQPRIPLTGRIAIVTDDGVATGATTQAALWAVRTEKPQRLVAALPVGPFHTIQRLADSVDEMLCLATPPFFAAVGQFYQRFEPVEDEDVIRILQEEHKKRSVK
jgi:putative phosphoribosyl transferase